MRLPLLMALVALAINLAVDWYIYRRLASHKRLRNIHVVLTALLTLVWVGLIVVPKRVGDDGFLIALMWTVYGYWTFYFPKYAAVIFDAVAGLPRLWHGSRWQWLTAAGAVAAAGIFCAMWWGALVERFRLAVNEVTVTIPNLPPCMNGMRVVQISDWHVGTYGTDTAFVSRTVDEINALKPDVILFTGDIVNRHSRELKPFTGVLSRLHAPLGVYSVMGNHDYGDYYSWPSEEAHRADADTLRAMQRRMGWHVLDNATAWLRRGSDSLALVGVENIGEPPFSTYGDLNRAYPAIGDSVPKILMSHNPAHWLDSISGRNGVNIALTLSGHTHAMQMRVGNFSPAAWKYPTWGGMYDDEAGHLLYVNTGIGTVGLPMRIGATPEITVFTLH
ncbi:MAG: metallophosphoesterase [Muribaculaceae bacterium]|nr:metallophosphoesterase [Muribaculaceae bacterium]